MVFVQAHSIVGTGATLNFGQDAKVIFDTGSSVTYMSYDDASTFNTALGFSIYQQVADGQPRWYSIDCTKYNDLPDLQLLFAGVIFKVTKIDYSIIYGGLERGVCLSTIVGLPSLGDKLDLLVGNSLLQRWFMIHDPQHQRMGFADVNYFGNSTQFSATLAPTPTFISTVAPTSTTTAASTAQDSTSDASAATVQSTKTPSSSASESSATLDTNPLIGGTLTFNLTIKDSKGVSVGVQVGWLIVVIILF